MRLSILLILIAFNTISYSQTAKVTADGGGMSEQVAQWRAEIEVLAKKESAIRNSLPILGPENENSCNSHIDTNAHLTELRSRVQQWETTEARSICYQKDELYKKINGGSSSSNCSIYDIYLEKARRMLLDYEDCLTRTDSAPARENRKEIAITTDRKDNYSRNNENTEPSEIRETRQFVNNQNAQMQQLDNFKNQIDDTFDRIIDNNSRNRVENEARQERLIRERTDQQLAEIAARNQRKKDKSKRRNKAESYAVDTRFFFKSLFPKGQMISRVIETETDTLYGMVYRNVVTPISVDFETSSIDAFNIRISKGNLHTFIRPKKLSFDQFQTFVYHSLWNYSYYQNSSDVTNIAVYSNPNESNEIDQKIDDLIDRTSYCTISTEKHSDILDKKKILAYYYRFLERMTSVTDNYDDLPVFPGMESYLKNETITKAEHYTRLRQRISKQFRRKADYDIFRDNMNAEINPQSVVYELSKDGKTWTFIGANSENPLILNEWKRILKNFPPCQPAKKNNIKVPYRDTYRIKFNTE